MSWSTESPARILVPLRTSASSATRSSSARPTIMARSPSLEQLLEGDHLAGQLGGAGQHHVERLVEHHLGTPGQVVAGEVGVDRDPHLATTGEDVDRAVVVGAQQGAVGRRWLGQLLDLVAQRGDVLAGLAQGVGQLLVLRDGLGQLALALEQALLEGAHPFGGVGQPSSQRGHLLLEQPGLVTQLGQLTRWVGSVERSIFAAFVDGDHLLRDRDRTLHRAPRRSAEHDPICPRSSLRSTLARLPISPVSPGFIADR